MLFRNIYVNTTKINSEKIKYIELRPQIKITEKWYKTPFLAKQYPVLTVPCSTIFIHYKGKNKGLKKTNYKNGFQLMSTAYNSAWYDTTSRQSRTCK